MLRLLDLLLDLLLVLLLVRPLFLVVFCHFYVLYFWVFLREKYFTRIDEWGWLGLKKEQIICHAFRPTRTPALAKNSIQPTFSCGFLHQESCENATEFEFYQTKTTDQQPQEWHFIITHVLWCFISAAGVDRPTKRHNLPQDSIIFDTDSRNWYVDGDD